jgi:hypothetical protein
MKRILLTLMATIAGSLSASVVVAGPSIGVVIGIPPIVISAPVYRPAPVYYAPAPAAYQVPPPYYGPAPVAYQIPRPYYTPAPVYYGPAPAYYPPAPVYGTRPVVVLPAPGYYAPVVVAPGYNGRNGHYSGNRGNGHGHYNRGYYGR